MCALRIPVRPIDKRSTKKTDKNMQSWKFYPREPLTKCNAGATTQPFSLSAAGIRETITTACVRA